MAFLDINLFNWLVFLLINGLVLCSSYCVASLWSKRSRLAATLVATSLVFFSQITVSILFFGVVLKFLNGPVLGVFNGLLSSVLLYYFWRERKPLLGACYQGIKSLFLQREGWLFLFLAILLLQLLIGGFKVMIEPVHVADSLAYRTPPAVMWYQMGQIPPTLDVAIHEMNGRSLGIAVLMLWFFVFLGDSIVVNLPQFMIALTLIPLVYAMARQCCVTRGWSLKIALLCYFLPSVLLQSTSTQEHLAVNVLFLAALFFMRELFINPNKNGLLLLGLAIGLMFSFKSNAVIYMPVWFVAFIYLAIRHKKMLNFRWRGAGTYVLLSLLMAYSVGGYWMTKNWLLYDTVFGETFVEFNTMPGYMTQQDKVPDHKSSKNNAGLSNVEKKGGGFGNTDLSVPYQFVKLNNLYENIKEFPFKVSDKGNAFYAVHLIHVSGFGPQFFALGLPALLLFFLALFRKKWRGHGLFYAAIAVLMLLVYFGVMHNKFAYRNFVFFPILMLLYFSTLLTLFKVEKDCLSKHSLSALMLVCMIWSLWHTLTPIASNPNILKEFVSLERTYQSSGRYLRTYTQTPKILRQLDELPSDEPIAYVNSQQRNVRVYANYDVRWQRHVEYISLSSRFFQCVASFTCRVLPAFKTTLLKKQIYLVNSCANNQCLHLHDPEFFEVGKGLYYFTQGLKK